MGVELVTEQTFEAEVLRSELPVLAGFFDERSSPCQQMAPEMDALAIELEGKAKVVKVDIEQSRQLVSMMRIQSVPTFIVFHEGRPVGAEQGVVPRARLRATIEPFLPRPQGAIRADELAPILKQGGVVPVDTRDERTYQRAHIPGAVNMPLDELPARVAELVMLGSAVVYCRSGDKTKALSEKLAADAVEVPFLEGGFLAWEALMLPIERS
ncbi:MAG: thioredoxin [Deltaproteobacteria bacterium]|nr:MAG: thioredoxin [Deltaproteobacteria bacterium]